MFVRFSHDFEEGIRLMSLDQVSKSNLVIFCLNKSEFSVLAMVLDAAVQVEMDMDMTARNLGDLDKQGLPDSYFINPLSHRISIKGLNESFQNVAVDS